MNNIDFNTSNTTVSEAAIQHAKEDLDRIEKELALGTFLPNPMRPQAAAMRRVPPEALRRAIGLTEQHSVTIRAIDVDKARRALEYEEAIAPIISRLRSVAARLDDSLMAIWHGPALQASALYGAAQSIDRLPEAQAVRELLKELASFMAPKRRRTKRAAPAEAPTTPTPPHGVEGTVGNGVHDKTT